ncbi:Spore germination protein GerKB [Candidatus Syntrophocurvum alkaliphilum]|uniref:Spore germination protein GerKB n=1 Tax=Candidatus Syntrophocurvum alkaliphilum TaxID=2293317 RepID=A0A6I6D8Y6_9FIRM|nr:endospore germination permease [Candidatus Syntrophocurvum alkaliphilum]QGT99398.1 Spore germination protein GerKB [Candidatus Syntrophocurvum alkaliphilum]
MNLDPGKIASSQLSFLVIGFLIGSSVLFPPGTFAGNAAWATVLVGASIGLLYLYIYIKLINKYPGKTIVEINEDILGVYLGKLFSFLYLLYFFHLGALVLRNFGDGYKIFLTKTPVEVIMLTFILLSAYAIKSGIEVIGRTTGFFILIIFFIIIMDTILVYRMVEIERLLPMFDISVKKFLQISFAASAFPFAEIVVFLMIVGFVNKQKETGKALIVGYIVVVGYLLLVAIRNVAVLGPLVTVEKYPSLMVVRLIDVAEVFTRIDVLVAFIIVIVAFVKITICYYATVLGVAQVTKMQTYKPLTLPIGILMLILAIIQFDNVAENINFAIDVYPYYALLFQFILPFLTLIIGYIRKFPGAETLND